MGFHGISTIFGSFCYLWGMKKYLLLLTLIASAAVVSAQDYKNAIGVRGGYSNGITFKHFISDKAALEFLLASRWRGYNFTVLYEVHKNIGEPGLNFYYGAGGHIGRWRGYKNHPWFHDDDLHYTVIGVDGIIGLEYNFKEIPLNLSIDYKPAFNLVGYQGFWYDEAALSVRIYF
jgi:hypothetical protein